MVREESWKRLLRLRDSSGSAQAIQEGVLQASAQLVREITQQFSMIPKV